MATEHDTIPPRATSKTDVTGEPQHGPRARPDPYTPPEPWEAQTDPAATRDPRRRSSWWPWAVGVIVVAVLLLFFLGMGDRQAGPGSPPATTAPAGQPAPATAPATAPTGTTTPGN